MKNKKIAKLNFNTVPASILKVWELSEDKYKQLKFNPSWRQLKTYVCLNFYLKYTECCNLTQYERKVKTAAQNLKKRVEDQQANLFFCKIPDLKLIKVVLLRIFIHHCLLQWSNRLLPQVVQLLQISFSKIFFYIFSLSNIDKFNYYTKSQLIYNNTILQ